MTLVDRLIDIVEPPLDTMGYDLVRVRLQGNHGQTVQIMAERKDGAMMTVDDCSDISHALSAVLDVEDPIRGTYTLEISSPGIDRPLTRPKDFSNWAGFDCKVETKELAGGRRRFSGRLLGVKDDEVLLSVDNAEIRLSLDAISKAKLILTDALIQTVNDNQGVLADSDIDIKD